MPTFVRVKDPDTGHEFDIPEGSALLAKGLVVSVKGKRYPPASQPRRPKHHVTLRSAPTPTTEQPAEGEPTPKES